MIKAVGVVVPARDEEARITSCLAAIGRASAALGALPVHLVVTADSCQDQTAARAARHGAHVVSIQAGNVGAARAAGIGKALHLAGDLNPADIWLANTDADTLVPPAWLSHQVRYANQGWDAVLGTVTVSDWTGQPAWLPGLFAAHYAWHGGPHPHVHGANLGIRASAYLAAGGFKMLATAEDHDIAEALRQAGCPALHAADLTVATSGRAAARAPQGFSHLLATLAAGEAAGGA